MLTPTSRLFFGPPSWNQRSGSKKYNPVYDQVSDSCLHKHGMINKVIELKLPCRRNLVLTDLLAFAIDFWMLPRYIPEQFGIFPKFNDGRR